MALKSSSKRHGSASWPTASGGGPALIEYFASCAAHNPALSVDSLQQGAVALGVGADLRGSYLFGSSDRYRSVLGGLRVAVKLPVLPIRPYAEGLIGAAGTRSNQGGSFSTATSVSFSSTFSTKFAYQVLGGLDWTILPYIDLRVAEVGMGGFRR